MLSSASFLTNKIIYFLIILKCVPLLIHGHIKNQEIYDVGNWSILFIWLACQIMVLKRVNKMDKMCGNKLKIHLHFKANI